MQHKEVVRSALIINTMTKKELLEIIKDYPDETTIVFTQENQRQENEPSVMYLDHMTECKSYDYINLYFKWEDVGS